MWKKNNKKVESIRRFFRFSDQILILAIPLIDNIFSTTRYREYGAPMKIIIIILQKCFVYEEKMTV